MIRTIQFYEDLTDRFEFRAFLELFRERVSLSSELRVCMALPSEVSAEATGGSPKTFKLKK